MTKKRMIVSLVCIVLALSMLVGAVLVVVMNRPEEPNGDVVGPVIEPPNTPTPEQGGTVPTTPEEGQPESETPPVVMPDFNEGNEQLLDLNLMDHLAAMERGEPMIDDKGNYQLAMDGSIIYQGGDEDTINEILDVLILMVNHFANAGYSTEANQQTQRLYVEYYELFNAMSEEERYSKIGSCIPATGAVAIELNTLAEQALGVSRSDGFAFVLESRPYTGAVATFHNVKLKSFDLNSLEACCVYDSVKGIYDEDFERNLEAWLHNVVKVVGEAELSEKHMTVAQLLYAHTLANAAYTANWTSLLLECLEAEQLTYESLKTAVNAKFGANIEDNTALREYIAANFEEVSA